MDRLGGRLGELEVELRYAWRAVDLLSQEYVKMWEKLERLEILLYEQQNVIAQLLSVIKSTGEDPEEYLNTRGDSVASDASLKDRLLMKHPDLDASDLSESDLLRAGFGAQADDDNDIAQRGGKWDKKYLGFACSSKYSDPSVSSETPDWEAASQGSPGYFHPDLLQYPRREIFTASDYKRYRGESPSISERDLEELDRLSANLHKVTSSTSSSVGARDVYKTLSHIKNSPLRRRMLDPEAESGLDPETLARIAKLPAYDEFDKNSGLAASTLRPDLGSSTESLRYTPDSTLSAKENEDLKDSSYLNRVPSSSWNDYRARGNRGMMYNIYPSEPQTAPIPPTRSTESSDYSSSNFLGHGIEERQKGHALTPVTEISPEYAASDTAGEGTGPSPTSTDKLGSVTDVTVSPLSPLDRSRTIKAEVHSGDGKTRALDTSPGGEVTSELQVKSQAVDRVSPNASSYNASSSFKEKPRRTKELPQIPYQKTKKSDILSVDSAYKKGSSNTFPPPKTATGKSKKGKDTSPVPGRRKLPQPYIDKSGNITYDKSQAVAPAPVPLPQDICKKYEVQSQSSDVLQSKPHYDSGQLPPDQKRSNIAYESESNEQLNYDRVDNLPLEKPRDQNENARYAPNILPAEQKPYDYNQQTNEQSYDLPVASKSGIHDLKTYQDTSRLDNSMEYSSQYYTTQDSYGNEMYPEYQQQEATAAYDDQQLPAESTDYQWDSQTNENWTKPEQVVNQYQYTDDTVSNIPTSEYAEYSDMSANSYSNAAYEVQPKNYQEPVYYESQHDQTYAYKEGSEDINSAQYQQSENYVQDSYNYIPQESTTDYTDYSYEQTPSQQAEQPTSFYSSENNYQDGSKITPKTAEEPILIPPEKPLREHERKQITPKAEKFTASPQHKGYSPQKSKTDRHRSQRQYSDPVTSGNVILSQSQSVTSGAITKETKQLSSSATSVAEDTSSTAGAGIFSVLSSTVSKGYKMISMPGLSKAETTKPPATSSTTTTTNKSGSMTSLFNIGSTLDSFKIGSRSKSRSDSVKSESELSLYDEPQAVIDYQEPATDRSSETYLLTKDAEEDVDVFYGEAEPEYQEQIPPQYPSSVDVSEGVEYQEEVYQDTLEYPDETVPDEYYPTQESDTYQEDVPPSSVENERTVTFAEEPRAPKESSMKQDRKKSLADETFSSLFQTVSRVRHPTGQSKQATEDSTESGVLTASVSNESAIELGTGDSRQSSIAHSEYGSLGSTESVVPYDRDIKPDTGSLESYGERGPQDDARSPEDRGSGEDGTSLAEGSIISEAAGSEEAGTTDGAPKKGKKVQFESRSPSVDSQEGEGDKVKKTTGSTKSKWMKLAVSTKFYSFILFNKHFQETEVLLCVIAI